MRGEAAPDGNCPEAKICSASGFGGRFAHDEQALTLAQGCQVFDDELIGQGHMAHMRQRRPSRQFRHNTRQRESLAIQQAQQLLRSLRKAVQFTLRFQLVRLHGCMVP